MARLLSYADRLSTVTAALTMVIFVVLVGDMIYEVVSRRVFGAPTLWAYDIAYMSNGAIFVLAAGYTLLTNEHIRIDFLSSRLRLPAQDWINAVVYVVLVLPAIAIAGVASINAAWVALITGELEPSSPWKPVIWPFYSAIAIGFVVLWLQVLAQTIRHVAAARGQGPSPLERAPEDH